MMQKCAKFACADTLKFETKKPAHFFLVKTVIPKLGHVYSIFFLETTKRPN